MRTDGRWDLAVHLTEADHQSQNCLLWEPTGGSSTRPAELSRDGGQAQVSELSTEEPPDP